MCDDSLACIYEYAEDVAFSNLRSFSSMNVKLLTGSLCRNCPPGKKNQVKVPKKIHKAEREKLKREHLNDLFLDLANALGNFCFCQSMTLLLY